jgi:guanidinopropionase
MGLARAAKDIDLANCTKINVAIRGDFQHMTTDQHQMMRPRYMGIASFMRAPLISSPSEADIAMVGVPFDGGVTNRPGARHGPRELRNQTSLMRTTHPATRVNPYDLCSIGDMGDVDIVDVYNLEACVDRIRDTYTTIHAAGAVPLTGGGDHCISFPILDAISSNGPLALLHVDAHTDTWDTFGGSKFMHGTPFRRAVESGAIDPERTIQIGIRGAQNSPEGWDYSANCGMRVMFMDEVAELGMAAVAAEARRVVGSGPVYLSFDIDALDPAWAPGTGTPESGGFTMREAIDLLRRFRGLDFVGADLVEVSPPFDVGGQTALNGATIMYEQLCLLAEAVAARRG